MRYSSEVRSIRHEHMFQSCLGPWLSSQVTPGAEKSHRSETASQITTVELETSRSINLWGIFRGRQGQGQSSSPSLLFVCCSTYKKEAELSCPRDGKRGGGDTKQSQPSQRAQVCKLCSQQSRIGGQRGMRMASFCKFEFLRVPLSCCHI